MRYHWLAGVGEGLPADNGTGPDPFYTPEMNDLLWAEGEIRSGGDKNLAATLINNSRVGRGGLAPVAGSDPDTVLIDALKYEQEIEFMGQGATAFFNRRRSGYNAPAGTCPGTTCGRFPYVEGLIPGTPRQMPVPAKELSLLLRSSYTFGGNKPDMVAPAGSGSNEARPTVADRWREIQAARSRAFLGSQRF